MAKVAKALTNGTDNGKTPISVLLLIYIIPAFVLLFTRAVWQLFIPAFVIHMIIRHFYKKDPFYLRYLIDELRTPERFEP